MDALTPAAALEELVVYKAVLEAGLGRPVVWYAYPYGEPDKMPEAARESVRQAGYRQSAPHQALCRALRQKMERL